MSPPPQPFLLDVSDEAIDDLSARLALTRFPDQAPGAPWAYGTDVERVSNPAGFRFRTLALSVSDALGRNVWSNQPSL